VKVTNASGCSQTSAVTNVTVNALPTATITASGPLIFFQGGNVTLTASSGSSYLWSPGNQTTQSIVVAASGTYSVRVTNSNGCSKISSPVTVVVNGGTQGAAFIIAGGPTTFCTGGSVTLSANAGISYVWSTGQTTQAITTTTSGSYVVTVTFTSNISTSTPVNVTVTNCSCPLPANMTEPSVSAYNATLQWGAVSGVDSLKIRLHDDLTGANYVTGSFSGTFTHITLGVGPGLHYHWRLRPKCSGLWTPWMQCNVSVFTTPILRESNPPPNIPLMELYRMENDGLDADMNSEIQTNMNIFPNPASSKATVAYASTHDGSIQLQLMNFTGKVMMSEVNNAAEGDNHYELDLLNIAKGIYLVIINDRGIINTKKIVVN
jgi:hypothetical protein